jgi:TetR/AcrR family transcriptional repressor of nem operon
MRISKAAGLTHGALYAHFRSKEELAPSTRDDYAGSCPIAASASEIGRQERAISACFSEKYLEMVGAIERGMGQDGDKRARAMTIVAALVGAQAVARGAAKSDPALSEQVLRAR